MTGRNDQIPSAYSRIARSEENFPDRATFAIDILRPRVAIEPSGGGALLSRGISGEIREHEERIGAREIVDERPEHLAIASGEPSIGDQIERRAQLGIPLEVLARAIALPLHSLDLGRRQAEQEEVVGPDFLPDLDVCAVERADR